MTEELSQVDWCVERAYRLSAGARRFLLELRRNGRVNIGEQERLGRIAKKLRETEPTTDVEDLCEGEPVGSPPVWISACTSRRAQRTGSVVPRASAPPET